MEEVGKNSGVVVANINYNKILMVLVNKGLYLNSGYVELVWEDLETQKRFEVDEEEGKNSRVVVVNINNYTNLEEKTKHNIVT